MNRKLFLLQEIQQTDLVDYLEKLGYQPQKIRKNDYWYLSPLRDEKTPSFEVNRKLNVWYDFGTGQGGNVIDFGMLYHKCSVAELLKKLPEIFFFTRRHRRFNSLNPTHKRPSRHLNLP
jgi:DNA primase